jgi:hypothetical protein
MIIINRKAASSTIDRDQNEAWEGTFKFECAEEAPNLWRPYAIEED